jgi:hypothetical protein
MVLKRCWSSESLEPWRAVATLSASLSQAAFSSELRAFPACARHSSASDGTRQGSSHKLLTHSPAGPSSSPKWRQCQMGNGPSWRWRTAVCRPWWLALVEAVHGQDGPPAAVGIAQSRQRSDGFGFRVDGLPAALWIFAAIGDQAPLQKVERALIGFEVLPDDEHLLRRAPVKAQPSASTP